MQRKHTLIITAAGLLFCAGLAQAANVVVDGDFNSDIINSSTYTGAVGQWITDADWRIVPGDLKHQSSYAAAYGPYGDNVSSLYQVIHYTGAPGSIAVSLLAQCNPYVGIRIYGSHEKPLEGADWHAPAGAHSEYHPEFGGYALAGDHSWSGGSGNWWPEDWTQFETSPIDTGYEWYTIRVTGAMSEYGYHSFIDNLVVDIPSSPVPVPGALWLFGSGLAAFAFQRKSTEKGSEGKLSRFA